MLQLVSPNFSDLLAPNIEIGKFPDGNTHVRIPNLENYKGREVLLFHRLYPDQNNGFFELLLILETLKEQKATVTLVVPYLPYARHEKQILEGEITSAPVTCNLIAAAGCKKIVTFDCHFLNVEGEVKYGNLLIQNFSMGGNLINRARQFFGAEPFEIIGLDEGAAYLVKNWGGKYMQKTRKNYENGAVGYRPIEGLYCEFDVKDKNVLLIDDMISTGSTMISGLQKMKVCGAKRLCCAVTHGLFLFDSGEKIKQLAENVFSADTIVSLFAQVSIKDKLNELQTNVQKLF